MKKTTIIVLTLLILSACQDKSENIKLQKQDPVPKTISLQEVSRIAIIEAEQFITNAKQAGIDISSINEPYKKAKSAYKNGEYKKAQIAAVNVRLIIEELTNNK